MRRIIDAKDLATSDSYEVAFQDVSTCPLCGRSISPKLIGSTLFNVDDETATLSTLYLCNGCQNTFMAQYHLIDESTDCDYEAEGPAYIGPICFNKESFAPPIDTVSPQFVKIYNQSSKAETLELFEIAGIGYRKALEFLIKDFLISEKPTEKTLIEDMALGKCIQDKIGPSPLQTVAQRAVWLGNDQTHYVQKYEDKDIKDLKHLINLSVHWISLILGSKEAEAIEKK